MDDQLIPTLRFTAIHLEQDMLPTMAKAVHDAIALIERQTKPMELQEACDTLNAVEFLGVDDWEAIARNGTLYSAHAACHVPLRAAVAVVRAHEAAKEAANG